MHTCRSLAVAAALLLPAGLAPAATTALSGPGDFLSPTILLDFDSQAHGTAANTLFSGVEFRNEDETTVPIFDWAGLSRVTTSSPNVIATVDGLNGSTFSNFIDIIFTNARTEIGAFFGNDQGLGSIDAVLTTYDASDIPTGAPVLVSMNADTDVDQFIGLRSDDPFVRARIEYITIGDLSVVLDDLQYSVVPEPGSGLLAGLGLLALGVARRRLA